MNVNATTLCNRIFDYFKPMQINSTECISMIDFAKQEQAFNSYSRSSLYSNEIVYNNPYIKGLAIIQEDPTKVDEIFNSNHSSKAFPFKHNFRYMHITPLVKYSPLNNSGGIKCIANVFKDTHISCKVNSLNTATGLFYDKAFLSFAASAVLGLAATYFLKDLKIVNSNSSIENKNKFSITGPIKKACCFTALTILSALGGLYYFYHPESGNYFKWNVSTFKL